jgi:hypothetical protein
MTEPCELCGRGTATKALTPAWWPYTTVCDRARCRAAARDATQAIVDARDRNDDLQGAIGRRREAQMLPVGWRDDTIAKMDVVENSDWSVLEIAKAL